MILGKWIFKPDKLVTSVKAHFKEIRIEIKEKGILLTEESYAS